MSGSSVVPKASTNANTAFFSCSVRVTGVSLISSKSFASFGRTQSAFLIRHRQVESFADTRSFGSFFFNELFEAVLGRHLDEKRHQVVGYVNAWFGWRLHDAAIQVQPLQV